MTQSLSTAERLQRRSSPIALVGAGCLVLLALGIFLQPGSIFHLRPAQFFRSWLFSWFFWFGISLGCMGIVMMHHLLGGTWGYLVQRFAEAAGASVPAMAALFIPILLGVRYLYPWAVARGVANDAVLRHKEHYLNWPYWAVRAVFYLLAFSLVAWTLRSQSLASDKGDPERPLSRLYRLSAGGQVLYFVLMSLAAVDWIMSREPHWYSTVLGFLVITSQALSAVCFLIIMVALFEHDKVLKHLVRPDYVNDLASVLIVFVIFWAYLSLSQFLIIWLGNSQSEITWYIQRTAGAWRWIGGALIIFHFFVPFLLLLLRPMKRKLGRLAAIAGGLLFMRVIDVLYWVTPSDIHDSSWHAAQWAYAELMNGLALVGIGGLWIAAFLWLLKDMPILPVGDRRWDIADKHEQGTERTSPAVQ